MKKFFRIFFLVLLAIVVLGTFYYLWKKSQPKVVKYEVVKPTIETISNKAVATGEINPRNKVEVKPQISGIIKTLYKKTGDKVQVGDVIATVQVIPDMSSLSSAQNRVKVAQIEYNQQKIDYDRNKGLYDKKVISKEDFENSQVSYLKAQEEFENAKDNLDIVKSGMSKNGASYSNTNIKATITGTILDIPIKVGNSVIQANTFNDGTSIATLADMSDLIFEGTVDETEVGRIQIGMPVDVRIGAITGQVFRAKLEYISPLGTSSNGAVLFNIKAAVQIPDTVTVRAGYSANAEIILQQADSVLSVPESCVELSGDSAFVYVLKNNDEKNPEYIKTQVKTGLSDGVNIQIKNGIDKNAELRGNQVEK